MTTTDQLIELIEDYNTAPCEVLLGAIADIVEDDYETLSPIIAQHGITY